ncbi:hypothetical protein NPIL_534731 [Nephila pilipes]|uniref:Uncharacterized protein n=1 Tax=Nephila pilipes TaxID=299642 RepID=A0A8X6PKW0_NEPPI|nr:hypothetical protein NPIL_534731 [Nephila pilipes]
MILRPLFLYACSIWGCTSKRNIIKLQAIQNKSLRCVAGALKILALKILHDELNTPSIAEEMVHQANRFYEKKTHKKPTIEEQKMYLQAIGRYPYPHQSMFRQETI